jgi:hypothetical protein
VIGKIFSIIAGILLINCFYMPWYKFVGIVDVSPLDVFNFYIKQDLTPDSLWKIASMIGIPILGGLMILTAIFPRLFLSLIKLVAAIFLCSVHIGYFYARVMELNSPFDIVTIVQTSPGFLIFLAAMGLYFFAVLLAILFSPIKGLSKLIGL